MKKIYLRATKAIQKTGLFAAAFLLGVTSLVALPAPAQAEACSALGVDHGYANTTVTVPETATYRIWSRLKTPDAEYNTYFLEIDGQNCFWVNGQMPANQWTWVGTEDAEHTPLTVNLSKGAHSLKLIGNDEGLLVDRVIFASDTNCVPTGNGSNCDNPTDVIAPTVQLTAPGANSTVNGQVAINANASDNVGVARVDFFLNSVLKHSDTSAPFGFTLNTTEMSDGDYQLIARAYDAAQNIATDSYKITIKNASIQVPPTPSNVNASSPTYNSTTITWDPVTGASGYQIYRDGVPIAQVGANATSFTDSNLTANSNYNYQVATFNQSGTASAPSAKVTVSTQTTNDTDAPSEVAGLKATAVNSGQVNLSWQASVDNVGVKFYDIYRGKGNEELKKVAQVVAATSYGDVNLQASTEYSYYVRARDANNNESAPSETVKVTTPTAHRRSVIYGTIRDQSTSKGIAGSTATLTKPNNTKVIQTASRNGEYIFRQLEPERYSINYGATNYNSKANTLRLGDEIIRKDVTLTKR